MTFKGPLQPKPQRGGTSQNKKELMVGTKVIVEG